LPCYEENWCWRTEKLTRLWQQTEKAIQIQCTLLDIKLIQITPTEPNLF
jgi:hypothetical protein